MARVKMAAVTADVEGGVLTFAFAHGATLTAPVHDVPLEIQHRLAMHGLEQKLRDAYAGAGSSMEAEGLARKVWDSLRSGQWSVRGAGAGAPKEDHIEILAQAVVAAATAAGRSLDRDAVRARLGGMNRSQLAKLRSDPRVAAELARLRGKESALDSLFE